jgi:hypothetical protein
MTAWMIPHLKAAAKKCGVPSTDSRMIDKKQYFEFYDIVSIDFCVVIFKYFDGHP